MDSNSEEIYALVELELEFTINLSYDDQETS